MITTLTEVKDYLNITDELNDLKISKLITYCEKVYLDIRGAPWDTLGSLSDLDMSYDFDYTSPVYPQGAEITIFEMIAYKLRVTAGEQNITGESLNSYTVNYETGTIQGFPKSIVGGIKKYVGAR